MPAEAGVEPVEQPPAPMESNAVMSTVESLRHLLALPVTGARAVYDMLPAVPTL